MKSVLHRQASVRVRRAQALLVYWRNGQLVFENYLTRKKSEADPVTVRVLHLCTRWTTEKQLALALPEYSFASLRKSIRLLLRQTLLVRSGSREARDDEKLARVWQHWLPHGSFHFATKNVKFARGERRSQLLKKYLRESPQPAPFKRYPNKQKICLSRPTIADGQFFSTLLRRRTQRTFSRRAVLLESISQLLFYTWGVTGYRNTTFGPLAVKTSPSGGARHPIEVYLVALNIRGLSPGLYHYDPQNHTLERLRRGTMGRDAVKYCTGQTYVGQASALFLMTAVFSRSMWKYRFARAYRVVTLDAGHLCQTFCLVATHLGLAPFCTAALNDSLIEGDLEIDGISESVIYVAGIGIPKTVVHHKDTETQRKAYAPKQKPRK